MDFDRRDAVRLLRIAVALLFVGVLAWRAGVGGIAEGGRVGWGWIGLAAILVPVSIGVRAYNHALLLNRPVRVLNMRDAYLLTLAGVGINLFVPTGAADLAKAGWGARLHGNAESMIVSSVLDKLTSLTAVGVLGLAGSLVARMPVLAASAAFLLVVSLLPTALPSVVPWRLLLRLLAPKAPVDEDLVRRVSHPPRALLVWVYAVSVAGWLLTYTVMWACCRAVGADVSLTVVFAFAPLTSVARLLPVSVAGIGVGEVTFAALLGQVGVPTDLASRAVLISMTLLVLAPGAVGAAIVARGRRRAERAD